MCGDDTVDDVEDGPTSIVQMNFFTCMMRMAYFALLRSVLPVAFSSADAIRAALVS